MVKQAKLINNENNYVVAIYKQDKHYDVSTEGTIITATSWDGDTGEPYDTEFFADLFVKWDGCSHFRFYGQDYIKETDEEKDSYYHFCGVDYYIQFMRLLTFAYEIMVEHVGYDRILEKEEYEELKQMDLLNGYRIEFE